MRRSFLTGVAAVAVGNGIITLFEKFLYSQKSLDTLHELLLQYNGRVAGDLFPPDLLMQKMLAWAFAAFAAGLLISALRPAHSKYVLGGVVVFFMLAALVNIAIVPHPSWFAASVPALFIVPLLGGAQLPVLIRQAGIVFGQQMEERPQGDSMQPAAL